MWYKHEDLKLSYNTLIKGMYFCPELGLPSLIMEPQILPRDPVQEKKIDGSMGVMLTSDLYIMHTHAHGHP